VITIVDYNMGNPGSIRNMLKKIGCDSRITSDLGLIAEATKLILPGVGAFDAGMDGLEQSKLIPVLSERVLQARVPILGICLGMQLMGNRSSEGRRSGLGWIAAEALHFEVNENGLKVPHMGWNAVTKVRAAPLLGDLPADARFYFVHSYFIKCCRPEDVLLTTSYGVPFDSAFSHQNIYGVQFHPEKSHRYGMGLLRNFAERC
jgi:imidazole glycerol-phosphate synthase subunit HisH